MEREKFNRYYQAFLGQGQEIRPGVKLCLSNKREEAFCHWYQQMIICSLGPDETVFSVGPTHFEDLKNYILNARVNLRTQAGCITVLKNFDHLYRVDPMVRLTRTSPISQALQSVTLTREMFIESAEDMDKKDLQEVLARKAYELEAGCQKVILEGKKIRAGARVSNIHFEGANIAVWTHEDYRGRGYGKDVVTGVTNWCLDNELLPIYLVTEANIPSLKLAKSLGYEIMAKEIICTKENRS